MEVERLPRVLGRYVKDGNFLGFRGQPDQLLQATHMKDEGKPQGAL